MDTKKDKASKIAGGLLKYLHSSKDEDLLPMVIEILERRMTKRHSALVITPKALNANQKKKARVIAVGLIKDKNVEFVYEVDPDIVDGMKIRFGDKLWDMSLSTIIHSLRGSI